MTDQQKKNLIKSMKNFSGATKFAKSIASLLVNLTADKSDLQVLKAAFTEMDEDGDGQITAAEFAKYSDELGTFGLDDKWLAALAKCDLQGKGYLSYNDFIASAIDHEKVLTRKNIEAAFKLFDPTKSGVIDISGI